MYIGVSNSLCSQRYCRRINLDLSCQWTWVTFARSHFLDFVQIRVYFTGTWPPVSSAANLGAAEFLSSKGKRAFRCDGRHVRKSSVVTWQSIPQIKSDKVKRRTARTPKTHDTIVQIRRLREHGPPLSNRDTEAYGLNAFPKHLLIMPTDLFTRTYEISPNKLRSLSQTHVIRLRNEPTTFAHYILIYKQSASINHAALQNPVWKAT